MNISKKKVILGALLLIIIWTGNIVYYKAHLLKEPIFIKHFYDIKQGMKGFELYYISNINDKDEIIRITFPEIDEDIAEFHVNDRNTDRRYYKLNEIYVTTNSDTSDKYKNKLITKAEVQFTSGRVIKVDIGKIYLYDSEDNQTPALKSNYVSSGSDNTGSARFIADKDINITGVSCKFPELINKGIKLTINNEDLKDIKFPLIIKNGEEVRVNYFFNFDKDNIENNNIYNLSADILTEDASGVKGYSSIYMNYIKQFPDQYNIKSMLSKGDK